MKKILQGISGLLVMLALTVAIIWLVQNAPNSSQELSTQISPLPTTTIEITESPSTKNPTFTPTTLSTVPMVVDVTSTPLPVPTIQPEVTSSPTPKPLSPLNKDLQTIIFTVSSEQGPQIYRVQVDETGQKAGPVEQIEFPTDPRMHLFGLFPSPDGQRVAVGWVIDTGTTHVSILDVASGQLRPLLGEAKIDQRVTFLAWSPDSQNVLVMGGTANPDLGNSAWLVDINNHQYHDVNIKQVNEIPRIYDATFSPDGETITYVQKDHNQGGSEIWRISLNSLDRQLLFKDLQARIENVLWSPDGKYIAFTRWPVNVGSFPSDAFGIGELYLMNIDTSEEYMISSIVIHFDNQLFRPVWSSGSQKIAFIRDNFESGEPLSELSGNLYVFNVLNGQTSQLTNFENTAVTKPTWAPDGSQIAFLINGNRLEPQFKWQIISVNDQELKQLGIDEALQEIQSGERDTQSVTLTAQSFLVWLP